MQGKGGCRSPHGRRGFAFVISYVQPRWRELGLPCPQSPASPFRTTKRGTIKPPTPAATFCAYGKDSVLDEIEKMIVEPKAYDHSTMQEQYLGALAVQRVADVRPRSPSGPLSSS
jgi:hypothetical protein